MKPLIGNWLGLDQSLTITIIYILCDSKVTGNDILSPVNGCKG